MKALEIGGSVKVKVTGATGFIIEMDSAFVMVSLDAAPGVERRNVWFRRDEVVAE